MPLMRIDLIKGHDPAYLKTLLDISYEAMKKTFGVPEGDRYQILTQHEPDEMQILDTGLGIQRTSDVVVFNLVTRQRTDEQKKAFYQLLTTNLEKALKLSKSDVVVSLIVNESADWSFGLGKAQFINGDL